MENLDEGHGASPQGVNSLSRDRHVWRLQDVWGVCVCVRVCVCMHTCVYIYVHTHSHGEKAYLCRCRSQMTSGIFLSSFPSILRWSLTKAGAWFQLNWLARASPLSQTPPVTISPELGLLTCASMHTQLLSWLPGNQTQVLIPTQQAFYHRAISLAQTQGSRH